MAKSSFEKDLYKLFSNSIYGKTLQSDRKHCNIDLVTDTRKAERLCAQPNFNSFSIVSDDVTMIKSEPKHIYWNKPIFVGFCVLELSKLLMYEFHYEKILPLYEMNASLCFTDTDSLCYELKNIDPYEVIQQNLDWFDTSDYPKDHPCYSPKNARLPGKFKDELNGKIVLEFVGLTGQNV